MEEEFCGLIYYKDGLFKTVFFIENISTLGITLLFGD